MMEYFSKFNREKHFLMLLLWDGMGKWMKDEGNQLTSKEKRKLTLAANHIWDASEMILERLGLDYRKQMIKDIDNHKAEVVRRSKVIEGNSVVADADLLEISNYAIVACNSMNRDTCVNFKKCNLYKAMRNANIPVCVLETDACPYRGEQYDKKKKLWKDILEIPPMEKNFKQAVCESCEQVWYSEDEEQWSVTICPDCGGKLSEWR